MMENRKPFEFVWDDEAVRFFWRAQPVREWGFFADITRAIWPCSRSSASMGRVSPYSFSLRLPPVATRRIIERPTALTPPKA